MNGIHPPLSDDVLVRYLDRQASVDEIGAVESLPADHASRARLAELRELSAVLSEAVGAIAVPELPPLRTSSARRVVRHALKAASIALLLAAGGAVAMPIARQAVEQTVRRLVGWVAGAEAEAEATGAVSSVLPTASVAFVLEGSSFTLSIEDAQEAGTVVFERGDGPRVIAVAQGAELLVLPSELRVRSRSGAVESVTVQVPRTVTSIVLRNGSVETDVTLGAAGSHVRVELGGLPE